MLSHWRCITPTRAVSNPWINICTPNQKTTANIVSTQHQRYSMAYNFLINTHVPRSSIYPSLSLIRFGGKLITYLLLNHSLSFKRKVWNSHLSISVSNDQNSCLSIKNRNTNCKNSIQSLIWQNGSLFNIKRCLLRWYKIQGLIETFLTLIHATLLSLTNNF